MTDERHQAITDQGWADGFGGQDYRGDVLCPLVAEEEVYALGFHKGKIAARISEEHRLAARRERNAESTQAYMQRTDPVGYQHCRDAGRF